jgi:hypothetical protein
VPEPPETANVDEVERFVVDRVSSTVVSTMTNSTAFAAACETPTGPQLTPSQLSNKLGRSKLLSATNERTNERALFEPASRGFFTNDITASIIDTLTEHKLRLTRTDRGPVGLGEL